MFWSPPVGEFGDRRVGGEAHLQVGEPFVVLSLGQVAVTRCDCECSGFAGRLADLAVGFAPRCDPHVAGLVEVRLRLET